LIKTAEV